VRDAIAAICRRCDRSRQAHAVRQSLQNGPRAIGCGPLAVIVKALALLEATAATALAN
jgi:hypothetical protein